MKVNCLIFVPGATEDAPKGTLVPAGIELVTPDVVYKAWGEAGEAALVQKSPILSTTIKYL